MSVPKQFSDEALRSLLAGAAEKDSFVFLESTRVNSENHRSYLFTDPVDRLIFFPEDDPGSFLRKAQEKQEQGFYLAGYLSYEFGYLLEPSLAASFQPPTESHATDRLPLADLSVFERPYVYDHLKGSFNDHGTWPPVKGLERAAR